MSKETDWLLKRAGKITSSNLKKLFTGGRVNLTPEQMAIIGGNRKTMDVEFGDVAIGYLYQLQYEKRLGKPIYQRDNYNFEFGKNAEPYAIANLRANHPDWDIKHCSSNDFDEIVFCKSESGCYDSPDFYVGSDIVGEVKCPVDQAKFEQMRDMTKEEVKSEYEYQLANHLNCNPNCTKLIYFIYSAQVDDDELDTLSPLAPSRGIIFEYSRSEFTDLITAIEAKVRKVMAFLDLVDRGELKADGKPWLIREINEFKYEEK